MRRTVLLLLGLLLLVAAKPAASCSVTPNPTAIEHEPNTSAYAYFTVTWTTPKDRVTVEITEPSTGPVSLWAQPGTGSMDWLTAYSGSGEVEILDPARHYRVLASCSFEVLP
jgi:hypothetical protein